MNSYYNQNYTEEDINKILEIIKECIQNNNYTIAMNENRQENIEFINEYNIRSDRQKSIYCSFIRMISAIHYKIQKLDMNMKCCMFCSSGEFV